MKIKIALFCFVVILSVSSCKTLDIPNNEPLDNIVLITGDTLYGTVDYIKEGYAISEFYRKIRLIDTNGRKKRFNRKKVRSFRIDGNDYESHRLTENTRLLRNGRFFDKKFRIDPNGIQHFLKVESKGKLAHYKMEWMDWDNNNLESTSIIRKAEDNFYIVAETGINTVLKKRVSDYLSDCPEVRKKITEKEFKYVFQVVDFYNENCEK